MNAGLLQKRSFFKSLTSLWENGAKVSIEQLLLLCFA